MTRLTTVLLVCGSFGLGGQAFAQDTDRVEYLQEKVQELLGEVTDQIDLWDDEGIDFDEAEQLLEEAEDLANDAENAYDDQQYSEAEELLEAARDLVQEAKYIVDDLIDERQDNAAQYTVGLEGKLFDLNNQIDELQDRMDDADQDRDFSQVVDLLEDAMAYLETVEDALDDNNEDDAEDALNHAELLIDEAYDRFQELGADADHQDENNDKLTVIGNRVRAVDLDVPGVSLTDGADIELTSNSAIRRNGDYTSLVDVDDALGLGESVYAQAAGERQVDTFHASAISFTRTVPVSSTVGGDNNQEEDDDQQDASTCTLLSGDRNVLEQFLPKVTTWFNKHPAQADTWISKLTSVLRTLPPRTRVWCVLDAVYTHLVNLILEADLTEKGRNVLAELQSDIEGTK